MAFRARAVPQYLGAHGIGDARSEHQLRGRWNLRKCDDLFPNRLRRRMDVNRGSHNERGSGCGNHVFHPLHAWNKNEKKSKKGWRLHLQPAAALYPICDIATKCSQGQCNRRRHDQTHHAFKRNREQDQAQKRNREAPNANTSFLAARLANSVDHCRRESHCKWQRHEQAPPIIHQHLCRDDRQQPSERDRKRDRDSRAAESRSAEPFARAMNAAPSPGSPGRAYRVLEPSTERERRAGLDKERRRARRAAWANLRFATASRSAPRQSR